MRFNFKSLHQSNIVFVFDPSMFIAPDNAAFTSLYEGGAGSGARFVDDPVIGTKFLHLPKQQLTVTLERTRLRIDDDSKLPPDETRLVKEAVYILNKLFPDAKLAAYGFNFDFFYRFPQVIPADGIFAEFASKDLLKKAKLRDLGIQFALEKEGGKTQEVFFIKFTGPIELALHYNVHHRASGELPKLQRLEELFKQAHLAPDATVEQLNFS
jgi:hypothetical protein